MDPSAHSAALSVSHLQLQQAQHNDASEAMSLDDRVCPGCKLSLVSEHGGLVVAFGQSFFHVDCFKCAKCGNKVTADTNLLLLSDGSPICANCSYSCNVCHQPILDEAIMTGDDSYHAHCFKCKVCKNRIDELVFAKTTQGIYCMNCHNERMIKIRRYTQKKAEREREKALNSSTSSRSREQEARSHTEITGNLDRSGGSVSKIMPSSRPLEPFSTSVQKRELLSNDSTDAWSPASQPRLHSPVPLTSSPHPLPRPSRTDSLTAERPVTTKGSALPPLSSSIDQDGRRPFDDGARPLNVLLKQTDRSSLESQPKSESLTITTSRYEKRRSINPGLVLDTNGSLASNNIPGLSPLSATFSNQSPYHLTSRDPPLSPTGHIPPHPPRPHSATSSTRSLSSPRAASPIHTDTDTDQTIVLHRTSAPTGHLHSSQTSPSYSYPEQSRNPVSRSEQSRFRTSLPTHHVDVPDTVDSETDPEVDSPERPPSLPPKGDVDEIGNGHVEASSEDAFESSPVERTSHATYIAPALPPIRFSLNTGDFSQLFNHANIPPSLKSLENLAKRTDLQFTSEHPSSLPTSHLAGFHQSTTSSGAQSPKALGFPATSQGIGSTNTDAFSSSVATVFSPLKPDGADSPQIPGDSTHAFTRATTSITLTEPGSSITTTIQTHSPDAVQLRLQEAIQDAKERNAQQLKLDRMFVEAILDSLETRKADYMDMKVRLDGVKRTSKQYIDGLTVAQTEYDKELRARRDAEAEVTRLRVLLSGQAARLTALSSESRRHELRQQLTKEIHDNLSGLEQDLSKLKVERDMALAEVEELSASKSSQELPTQSLGRSLTMRLDNIRVQYQRDLIPLNQQREALTREIAELRAVRDVFLEETTALNARNEELAQLGAAYARRVDSLPDGVPRPREIDIPRGSLDKPRHPSPQPSNTTPALSSSTTSSSTLAISDETTDPRYYKISKTEVENATPSKGKFKWPGAKTTKDVHTAFPSENKGKGRVEHNFQQLSILRFTRCDHCGDKMWGSQLRCTACNTAVHVRCIGLVQSSCFSNNNPPKDDHQPLPPSMFGRDLIEQVRADTRESEERWVPVIVEKCIDAVDTLALEYEGIYRKTGGSGQSKAITQLFESGDYASFDLRDSDRFNDICSITSVLKTYFRSLPTPLLTFDLHDDFMQAAHMKDAATKHNALLNLINKLPKEHYFTLRLLMLHLARIREKSDQNLMNARNLGIVFGPTLMRSRDPGAEFSDMAGKALSIEWMVDNAAKIFS